MIIIRRNKFRLKPGGYTTFFENNKELFQDLKNGLDVEIPDVAKEEVLEAYEGLVEIVKKKKSKKIKVIEKGKEVNDVG